MLLDAPCVKTQPIPIKDSLSFFLHEDAAVLLVLRVSRPGKSWPSLAYLSQPSLQCNKVSKAKNMSFLWFCHISFWRSQSVNLISLIIVRAKEGGLELRPPNKTSKPQAITLLCLSNLDKLLVISDYFDGV